MVDGLQKPLIKDTESNLQGCHVGKGVEASTKNRHSSRLRMLVFLVTSIVLVFVLLARRIPDNTTVFGFTANVKDSTPGFCASTDALPVDAPHQNVWKNFNVDEATVIRNWLWAPQRSFNLTKEIAATDFDNSIQLIETFTPPKADALSYIDGEGALPHRYAKIIINHGAYNPPSIGIYVLGPLPSPLTSITLESADLILEPLTHIYHRPDVPYTARMFPSNASHYSKFLFNVLYPIQDATLELLGGRVGNDPLGGNVHDLVIAMTTPLSYDGTWRRAWYQLRKNGPGYFLKPLDLYFYVDQTSHDPSEWHLIKMVYNKQIFNTTSEFMSAFRNGTLKRSPHPDNDDKLDGKDWTTRTRKGAPRDLDERAGPRSVMFNGPRYRADRNEGFVSWMGWSFFMNFERDMGLALWDINFRGERMIYELAPQEALAVYSGNNPHQGSTVFLDRGFGMGTSTRELILGYDCPVESLLFPATVHAGSSSIRQNAICIFEQNSERPLSRHTGYLPNEMGAVKGYQLTVRSISTVGNYDYLFDYTFQLDGSIEVRLSASGYLQGGWWTKEEHDYGTRIRNIYMGSLHDHVINYKIDFDINGTRNSFTTLTLENEVIREDWFDDSDWGSEVNQQKIIRRIIGNENDSVLNYPNNYGGMYVITNEEAKNRWGYSRGYGIHPGISNIHMTNLNSKRTDRNVNFAKQHFAVSRRKDTEPSSSSMWNINLPGNPPVDFFKFFDGESLEQEDLVVWLNLGMHHIPRAEDSPMTLTNVATSSVLLVPVNFNDFDPSIDSLNAIVMQVPEPGETWEADENNVRPNYCLPSKLPGFSYKGLQTFEEDGSPGRAATILEMRKEAEGYHAIFADQI